jgi:2-polyprenyl-3-methyl-5-hydroxy-6-metoxy-1,4-benzoquinol methylase
MQNFSEVSIDAVRNYWNKRPCNIRHSTKPIGSKQYYDEVEARKYFVEPHIPAFADFAAMQGKKVLEIGCGIGVATINFARAGAEITAVDLSKESIAVAKKNAEACGLSDRIRFYQGNSEELSKVIPDEKYDLIYSFGVIHHSPHPDKILAEIHAHLKPGGQLKLMVYHRRSWKVLAIILGYGKCQFWKIQKLIAKHSEAEMGCPVTYSYTKKEARQLLAAHGFSVTGIQVDHIFPYRVKDYVNYRYRKNWYFRWMPAKLFRFLERKLGWHLCIYAIKND